MALCQACAAFIWTDPDIQVLSVLQSLTVGPMFTQKVSVEACG